MTGTGVLTQENANANAQEAKKRVKNEKKTRMRYDSPVSTQIRINLLLGPGYLKSVTEELNWENSKG